MSPSIAGIRSYLPEREWPCSERGAAAAATNIVAQAGCPCQSAPTRCRCLLRRWRLWPGSIRPPIRH